MAARGHDTGHGPAGLIGPPLVWAGHFLAVYVVNAIACEKGLAGMEVLGLPLVPLAVVALTLAALGALVLIGAGAWRRFGPVRHQAHRVSARDPAEERPARQHFQALTTLLLVMMAALATLMVGLPALWVPPCA